MKPYLYHTIITDLEKGGVFHYFGKHKGTNPVYKGSGRAVKNAKALNKQCKKDGLPERYVLEHIVVQEFDTYKECSKNEKFIIALGKEQFGEQCLNIRTEEKENSPYIFDEKFQKYVSINKSKAMLKKWADPELRAKRLSKFRETYFINQKTKFVKTPFSFEDLREMAKYITHGEFIKKMGTYGVKLTSCNLFDFAPYVKMSPFMDMKVLQEQYKKDKGALDIIKHGINIEHFLAYKDGIDTPTAMFKKFGQPGEYENKSKYRRIIRSIEKCLGIKREIKKGTRQNQDELYRIWLEEPMRWPSFKDKVVALGYKSTDYSWMVATFCEKSGIKFQRLKTGAKFRPEIADNFEALKNLWQQKRDTCHKFRTRAVAAGYANINYMKFVQTMMTSY